VSWFSWFYFSTGYEGSPLVTDAIICRQSTVSALKETFTRHSRARTWLLYAFDVCLMPHSGGVVLYFFLIGEECKAFLGYNSLAKITRLSEIVFAN